MLAVRATSDSSPLICGNIALYEPIRGFRHHSVALHTLISLFLLAFCSWYIRSLATLSILRVCVSVAFVAIPFFALPKCARLTPRVWLPGKCGAECGRVCIIRENGNNVSCETMESKSRSGGNRASCPCFGTKIGLGARFLVLMFVCLRCYWFSRQSSVKIRLRGADRAIYQKRGCAEITEFP